MRNTVILTYEKELNELIPFSDRDRNIFIQSLAVDIIIFPNNGVIVEGDAFTVKIGGHGIEVECRRDDLSYIVLPFSVMVSIGKAPVYEKVVVADWLYNLLKELPGKELENPYFDYRDEGFYNVELIHRGRKTMKENQILIDVLSAWRNAMDKSGMDAIRFILTEQMWIYPKDGNYVVYGLTAHDDSDYGCELVIEDSEENQIVIRFDSSKAIESFIKTGNLILQ